MKLYVESLVGQENVPYVPAAIDNLLRGIRISINISHAEARITFYSSEFVISMATIGYADFKTDDPNQTVNLLAKRVYPK